MIGFSKEPGKLLELHGSRGSSSTAINSSLQGQTEPTGTIVPWTDKREIAKVRLSRGN